MCIVTDSMTITRAKIEVTIPRKRRGSCTNHDKAVQRFYDTVMQAVLRHIRFEGERERGGGGRMGGTHTHTHVLYGMLL